MSFNGESKGKTYAPGYFLAHEECERKTRQVGQSMATTESNGTKYVKAGTPYPSNDSSAQGFIYDDTDVTSGTMPASVVFSGVVYSDALPVTISGGAKTALEATGFKFETTPSVTRPY